MKKTLFCLTLLTTALAWISAEDSTTVQVAPSDQVIYPDASQILNKTDPKAKPIPPAPLGSTKPLAATTPTLARPANTAAAAPVPAVAAHGWFLRWTVSGDEAGVKAWAAPLGAVILNALGTDLWEVLSGPVPPEGLKAAMTQSNAQLVKR